LFRSAVPAVRSRLVDHGAGDQARPAGGDERRERAVLKPRSLRDRYNNKSARSKPETAGLSRVNGRTPAGRGSRMRGDGGSAVCGVGFAHVEPPAGIRPEALRLTARLRTVEAAVRRGEEGERMPRQIGRASCREGE